MSSPRPYARLFDRTLRAAALFCLVATVPPAWAAADPTELEVIEHVAGDGAETRRGWFATVRYTGWVYDAQAPDRKGARFVHSDDKGRPVTFVYGFQRALPGMEKGMQGMKVGARRTIVIPPRLGFAGSRHHPPEGVARDAALVIDVELLDVVQQANANLPADDASQ